MSEARDTGVVVVQPDEGDSFWQPVPANGYAEVRVSHRRHPAIRSLTTGIQVIAPGCHIREHVHPREEELLCFFDFPAEHWLHLKTSNPIESTFATVRLRTRVTKGPGSKAAGLAMAFKLLEAAQDRWRAVNGPQLLALVRAGARFDKGVMVERPDEVQEVAA